MAQDAKRLVSPTGRFIGTVTVPLTGGSVALNIPCDHISRRLILELVGNVTTTFGAGNGVGLGGQRSGLYWHFERLIKEKNPRFVFLENVPAIRTRGRNSVAQSLTHIGRTVASAK